MCIKLTDQNFDDEIKKSGMIMMVDFWAPWCGPCQTIKPIIEQLSKEFEGKIKVGKLNVDENPKTASKHEILSIPTIKFFKDGKVIYETTGAQPKEVLAEKINSLLADN